MHWIRRHILQELSLHKTLRIKSYDRQGLRRTCPKEFVPGTAQIIRLLNKFKRRTFFTEIEVQAES